MTWQTRGCVAGAVVLAFSLSVLAVRPGTAADDKGAAPAVRKLADSIEKGDAGAAKEQADAIAKTFELEEVMHMLLPRAKKGEGVGEKPGVISPDGIEARFLNLGKKPLPPKQLEKEGAALARAAYITAAIAEVAERKAPEKKEGTKDPKDWIAWTKDMKSASIELAKAARGKDPKIVKEAASKLNSSCSNCHGVFRD